MRSWQLPASNPASTSVCSSSSTACSQHSQHVNTLRPWSTLQGQHWLRRHRRPTLRLLTQQQQVSQGSTGLLRAQAANGFHVTERPQQEPVEQHVQDQNGSAVGVVQTPTATSSSHTSGQQHNQQVIPCSSTEARHAADTADCRSAGEATTSSSPSADSGGKKQLSSLANRIIFGIPLGLAGGAIVTAGKLPFLLCVIFVTYQATQEYYGFITSKSMSSGMTPPPPAVSVLTTVLCVSIALLAYFYRGRSGTVLAVTAFILMVLEVLVIQKPKFSQLASSVFGLFYCGWLPSFWVKLRELAVPAPATPVISGLLRGVTSPTVGLLATFTTVACVIAADTGAFFVGKNMGRTQLTEISPKKTVEGAVGGLASSVGVALLLRKVTSWPATPLMAAVMGVIVFLCGLYGDLIESIMKRDAGVKDSGNLIPGHGGLLDRVDSYIFTGAVVFFYIHFLPNCGAAATGVPAMAALAAM